MNRRYNNDFNERIYKEMQHKFSVMDLDAVIFHSSKNGNRVMIVEHKYDNEPVRKMQEVMLKMLQGLIDWSRLDHWSGVYILRELGDDKFGLRRVDKEKGIIVTFKQLETLFAGGEL